MLALHHRTGRAVPVGRRHVAAHHPGDLRQPLCAAAICIGRSSPTPGPSRTTAPISGTARSWSSTAVASSPSSARWPRIASRATASAATAWCASSCSPASSCRRSSHPLAVPDPAGLRPLQHAAGLIVVYVAIQSAADRLHPRGLLRADSAGPVRRRADRRLFGFRDLLAHHAADRRAGDLHHGHPQLHPAVERIPLRRGADHRRRQAHLAARHQHFMGGHQLDVGMIATGLMIAIVPRHLFYAFFSEKMTRGMTAGAVSEDGDGRYHGDSPSSTRQAMSPPSRSVTLRWRL